MGIFEKQSVEESGIGRKTTQVLVMTWAGGIPQAGADIDKPLVVRYPKVL